MSVFLAALVSICLGNIVWQVLLTVIATPYMHDWFGPKQKLWGLINAPVKELWTMDSFIFFMSIFISFWPFKHMVWFLACQEIKVFLFWRNQLKSGIGSCIAPNAGLARHPVKGKYICNSLSDVRICRFWLTGCAMLPRTREHSGGTLFVLPASK